MSEEIHIIGGGLAGCEAGWQIANQGVKVIIHEMRPSHQTDVHKTDNLAELVCSNSFRSDDHTANAVGVLHQEMRLLNSLIMSKADAHAVPAGGALAVDRDGFAASVEEALASHPMVTIKREAVSSIPPPDWKQVIIATGPLTSPDLAASLKEVTGEDDLAFFDALAPIIYLDSIDMKKAWRQSRYDKGEGNDYINCPMDQNEYESFIAELIASDKMEFHEWERSTPYFEGCMPVEVMAERGIETLRFGPMKPVGLTDPSTGKRPHAVVQLRQDNALGTLYNIVGFQTKMKHAEQVRVFRMIPGLTDASFARLGGLHRNTFIRSPKLLDHHLRLKAIPRLRFAGQMTGVEGYVESAATGLMAGLMAAAEITGRDFTLPPLETAHGALLNHITNEAHSEKFQPMNVNFGLFPPLPPSERKIKGVDRRKIMAHRAIEAIETWKVESVLTLV